MWVQKAETTSETTRTLGINEKNPNNILHTFLGTKITRYLGTSLVLVVFLL